MEELHCVHLVVKREVGMVEKDRILVSRARLFGNSSVFFKFMEMANWVGARNFSHGLMASSASSFW